MNISISNRLEDVLKYIKEDRKVFLLTDDQVYKIYSKDINKILDKAESSLYIMDNGEINKNKSTVFSIYDEMILNNIGRYDLFIGFGGGVVGDIGGFVASTYMRGIDYIQIATSFLAQVDSSVGAKTGFDYRGYKNIIGTFKEPLLTYINTDYLLSLGNEDFVSGLGEVLKYGLIDSYDFFTYLEENKEKIWERDRETLNYCVARSVEIKKSFVEGDLRDFGKRRKLNFGHTVGHAIEAFYGFKKYKHGEAVILGMIYESYIAYLMGLIDYLYFQEILKSLSFYVDFLKFNLRDIEKIIDIMKKDKKNKSDNISMIVPVGRSRVDYIEEVDLNYIIRSLEGEWYED